MILSAFPLLLLSAGASADFTISSYTALALATSPEVATAKEAFEAADAAYGSQLAASILPTLAFTASDFPYGDNPSNNYQYQSFRLRSGDVTLNTSANLNLFNSFQDWQKDRAARLARDSAERVYWAARQDRALAALQAFYDLDAKEKLTDVARQNLKAQDDQYRQSLDLYNNGMKSLADLLKSETDWRSSQLRLLDAVQAERLSLAAFNGLVDRPGLAEAALTVELEPGTTALPSVEADVAKALERRPEVQRARTDVERARVAVQQAVQGALPSVQANLTWNRYDQATFGVSNSTLGIPTTTDYLGLSLSLPLGFNAVSQWFGLRQAKAGLRQAEAALVSAVRQVRLDVYGAYVNLDHDVSSYALAVQKEEISRRTLDLVSDEYRQDTADAIRMNLAQTDLLDAQVSRTLAIHSILTDRAQYSRALGEPLW